MRSWSDSVKMLKGNLSCQLFSMFLVFGSSTLVLLHLILIYRLCVCFYSSELQCLRAFASQAKTTSADVKVSEDLDSKVSLCLLFILMVQIMLYFATS